MSFACVFFFLHDLFVLVLFYNSQQKEQQQVRLFGGSLKCIYTFIDY